MSYRRSQSKSAIAFEPAVILGGGAGYGAWTECSPDDPVLAHRLAEAFSRIEYLWATAPTHEREELIDWLICQWNPPASRGEGAAKAAKGVYPR